jgi:hypothetical protein
MQIVKLFFDTIFKPVNTFDRLIKERHFILGFIVWFIFCILYLFRKNNILIETSTHDIQEILIIFSNSLKKPSVFWTMLAIFPFVYIENIIGQKVFKFQSRYAGLLACNLFIFLIDILGIVTILIVSFFRATSMIWYLNLAFSAWSAGLNILAVRTVYKTNTTKGIKIYMAAAIIMYPVSYIIKTVII